MEGIHTAMLVFVVFIASWTQQVIGQAVTVGFSQKSYTFSEDEDGLVCVVLLDGSIQNQDSSVTLTVNATDGSATTSDNDYNPALLLNITLSPSTPNTGECISSTILPDDTLEEDESFTLSLKGNGMVNLSSTMSQTQVVILNDDAACPSPQDLMDGSFALSSPPLSGTSGVGVRATYSCSLGFTLDGPDTLICQLGNLWSPAAPGTCQALDCPPLTDPENGKVEAPSNSIFSLAVYSCNDGYELMGMMERLCFVDSRWTESAPTCEARDCGPLTPPDNGTVDHVTTTFPSVATYSCSTVFILEGDSTRTCQADGSWSNSEPTCRAVLECPPLTDPENGKVEAPSNSTFASAVYSCNDGYELMGTMERLCFVDYRWTESAPTCEAKDCGPLTPPDNGTVDHVTTTFPSVATYSCSTVFILEGDSTRTCQADGSWSNSEPICRAGTTCPEMNLKNGVISSNSESPYPEGEAITYICDKGYILTGNATRICLVDGWTGSDPSCTIVDCGALSSPKDGSVEHATTTYLSVATYLCNSSKFTLIGQLNRQCLETGDWEGSMPTCSGAKGMISSGVLLLVVMAVLLNLFLGH